MRVLGISNFPQASYYYKNTGILRSKLFTTQDTFSKQQSISFRSEYNKTEVQNFIAQIEQGKPKSDGHGYQSAFYIINENIGIKAPNPKFPNSPIANKLGENNRKEFLILNMVKEINPKIAVNPIDLIEQNNKNYLVMDVIKGKHPLETKLCSTVLDDLTKKCYELDINGIMHYDLQNGNIFINQDKAKFIDFGSNGVLLNDGTYISSDSLPANVFEDFIKNKTNNPKEKKFLTTFYNKYERFDLKNNSDNLNLKIKSNISNLEYRLMYDYLAQNKKDNPKEYLTNYLKSKAENYHKKMIDFLEHLEVSPNDIEQSEQIKKAINTEKMFIETFSNPSENVLKTELGKMQLKWLINDHQGNQNKAYDYLIKLQESINVNAKNATGSEKKYFINMQEFLKSYENFLNNSTYKGSELEESKDLVKTIWDNHQNSPINEKPPEKLKETPKKSNKTWVIVSIITALTGGIYLYNKNNKKTDKQNICGNNNENNSNITN